MDALLRLSGLLRHRQRDKKRRRRCSRISIVLLTAAPDVIKIFLGDKNSFAVNHFYKNHLHNLTVLLSQKCDSQHKEISKPAAIPTNTRS
jgi:hypothetical protein